MSAHHFAPLGPLSPDGRAHLGVEIQGSGQPALPVVMVWVPKAITEDAARLAELQTQTESAVRLDHPNIIRVRGLEKLDEGWARVVEFADAESLRKLLDATRGKSELLWPAIVAAIVADACQGVHHAHEIGEAKDAKRPQLHGGLRPDVLLVNYKGQTKVTGYGAAAFAPTTRDAARDAYTAPEQVLGGREAMTRQTDIYQLGAVLYECLAGVPPFTAEEGLLETLILQKMPGTHRLSEFPELGEIAMKALAKKASDRYPTAAAMRDAILACGTPPVANDVVARWINALYPPSHPERSQRRELIKEALATTGATQIPDDLASALAEPAPVDASQAPSPIPPEMPVPDARPPVATPAPEPAFDRKPAPAVQSRRYEPSGSGAFSTPPQPSHGARNVLLGVLAGGAIAGGWWLYRSGQRPPEDLSPRENAGVTAVAPLDGGQPDAGLASASVDSGAAVATAAELVDGGTVASAAPDAGPVAVGAAKPDAGTIIGSTADKLVLEVVTDPPLQVRIDGDAVGRGSVHASLSPGRHRVEASDKSMHIFAAREVNLARDHQRETITIGKAQLAFDVPPGATVTVDGKEIGKAPVDPVTLYAGSHEAVVEFNGAKTVQRVPITADFNVTLTVHAQ